jgi:hypothetical protein
MVNNEHSSSQSIDQRINPSLHPDYDPDKIAIKLAAKRARIKQSMETFSQYQAKSAAKEAAKKEKQAQEQEKLLQERSYRPPRLTYEDNPTGYGWLMPKNSDEAPVLVPHNRSTDSLFVSRIRTNETGKIESVFEVVYQGSGDIVGLLEMYRTSSGLEQSTAAVDSGQRRLAFFDKKGTFYDQARLKNLEEHLHNVGDTFIAKHTAIFSMPHNGRDHNMPIAIDDIYCLSLAIPPDTRSRAEKLLDNLPI